MSAASSPATAVRYRDVAAAVDWLCKAFGFEKQTVVTSDGGAIEYAQLTCGRALLMMAPVRDTPLDRLMKQPDEIGGAATQSCYIVVEDADAHYDQAKEAGATIVLDLQDDDFGGRGYSCRDLEGHLWMFGTYDPWQGQFPEPVGAPVAAAPAAAPEAVPVRGRRRPVVLAGLAMTAVAALAVAVWLGGFSRQPAAVSSAAVVREPAPIDKAGAEAHERAAEAVEEAVREARAQLERERLARASADKASAEAQKRIAEEQRAREAAEKAIKEARLELERERVAKAAVEKASAGALERLAAETEQRARETEQRATQAERRAKQAAEKAAKEARAELERGRAAVTAAEVAKEFALGRAEEERLAREAAERVVDDMREQLERERAATKGGPPAPPVDTEALKRVAKAQQALETAQKQAAEATRAREAAQKQAAEATRAREAAQKQVAEATRAREEAEKAAQEARELLTREQAAKAAAWRVVGQLTRQLKKVQANSPDAAEAAGDDGASAPKKKYRPRPKKKAQPDE